MEDSLKLYNYLNMLYTSLSYVNILPTNQYILINFFSFEAEGNVEGSLHTDVYF